MIALWERGTNYLKKFSYDGLGNLRTENDRRGRIVDYAYDNRNRVTTETWKTTSTVSRTFNYAYDNLDRTTAIDDSDPFSTDFQYVYDAKSQLQSERQSPALVGTSVALDRNYDIDGNETQLIGYFGATINGQSFVGGIKDFINNVNYDGMNRVASVTQATPSQGSALGVNTVAAKSAYFTYNAASQLTDMRRYNSFSPVTANLQVHSRYAYDGAGRLTSITHGRTLIAGGESWNGTSTVPASLTPSTLLAAYSYSYDTANRITSMSSYRDAFKAAYTYDDTNQLTAVANTAISGLTPPFALPQSEGYQLDANGNRKSTSGASQSAAGTQNRLQTDGTYNYTYDAEGNTTQRTLIATGAVTDYGYTYKNWLASVTERTTAGGAMTKRTEFVYDAFGQRVGKRVDSDGNGAWDRHEAYVWADGQEVLRLVDSDGDGTAQPFRVANRYLYAGAVDELLADEQFTGNSGPAVNATSGNATAGNTLYPLTDHLGSVRDLIDNNGINRQHVVYDGFGRRTLEVDYNASGTQIAGSDPAAIDELFGYTGRDWDTDVGLQYNRARWYNPSTGRWMNQDPIGFVAGDVNLYRYVGNEATGATDPSGLEQRVRVPAVKRGKWTSGEPGNGTFRYHNNGWAKKRGLSGAEVKFSNNHIAVGGFPQSWYYGGSVEAATVTISTINGDNSDFKEADAKMREKLNDPNWKRPKGYTWNHAGDGSCQNMELVESKKGFKHGAVAHRGSAALPRAAMSIVNFYDIVKMTAELSTPQYEVHERTVYFEEEIDGSVFYIEKAGLFSSAKIHYVQGPMAGQSYPISSSEYEEYDALYHLEYGTYHPGYLFWGPTFTPGTKRSTLPVYKNWWSGEEVGWVDEDGVHECAMLDSSRMG